MAQPDRLEALRARIESGAYVVDCEKVAEAILERLRDGRGWSMLEPPPAR